MEDAVGVARNGWAFWQVERTRERLDTVQLLPRSFRAVGPPLGRLHLGIARHVLAHRHVRASAGRHDLKPGGGPTADRLPPPVTKSDLGFRGVASCLRSSPFFSMD